MPDKWFWIAGFFASCFMDAHLSRCYSQARLSTMMDRIHSVDKICQRQRQIHSWTL